MKRPDNLSEYVKELPKEQPSANFTLLVMDRVRLESMKSPVVYQPIFSKQVLWSCLIGIILSTICSIFLGAYFPGKEPSILYKYFTQIDFSWISKPVHIFVTTLNHLSGPFLLGFAAISMLFLVDQLYSRYANR